MHPVTIRLGEFTWRALTREDKDDTRLVAGRLVRAIQMYLRDKGNDGPGWRYPLFARGVAPAQAIEVTIDLPAGIWRSLRAESERQGVTVEQLVNHAALYVAAEIDSGRATERILDDLDESGG